MIYRTVTVEPTLTKNIIEITPELSETTISVTPELSTTVKHNTVSDYELLINKPLINSVTLQGDKSFEDLGLEAITNMELENLLK